MNKYPGLRKYRALLNIIKRISDRSDFIKSFWAHGSRVKGTYHRYSDLDIAFVVKEHTCEKLKMKLCKIIDCFPNFPEYFLDSRCEYWEFQGREIGIHIYTERDIKQRLKNFSTSVDCFELNQSFVQHTLIESFLLVDKDNTFGKYYKSVINYPDNMRVQIIKRYGNRLKQKFVWWEKRPFWKNVFEEICDLELIIDEIAKLQYAINRQYHMHGLKEYSHDLSLLFPNIKREVLDIADINPLDFKGAKKRKKIINAYNKLTNYYEQKR